MARTVSTTYSVDGIEESKAKVASLDKAIDGSVKQHGVLGQALGSLSSKFGSVGQTLGSFASQLPSATTLIAGAAGAVAGVAVALSVGVGLLVSYSSQIKDLAGKYNLTTTEAQRFKFAAEQTGTSVDAFGRGIQQLSKHLTDGDKGTVNALKAMGLSIDDLRQMNPGQAFETVADAVGKIQSPMEQSRVAMQLFGRSGAEILPAMKEGIGALGDKAAELGQVLGGDVIQAGEALGDTFGQLKSVGGTLLMTLVIPLIPLLQAWADHLVRITPYVTTLAMALGNVLGAALGFVITKIQEFSRFIGGLIPQWLKDRIGGVVDSTKAYVTQLAHMNQQAPEVIEKQMSFGRVLEDNTVKTRTHKREIETLGLSYKIGWEGAISKTMDASAILKQEFYDLAAEAQKALKSIPHTSKAVLATVSEEAEFQGATAGNRWGSQFGTTIAQSLLRAFQGGGDVGRSLGGAVGNQFGQMAGDALAKAIGGSLGGVLGSVLPGIGTALGGLAGGALGGLMGRLFKTEGRQVNDMRDDFISAAGGLDALNKKAAEAGMTLDALLRADKVKEFNEAVNELNLGFGEQAQQLSELQGLLEKYGLTWEDVGQKAKQAHLEELAMGLESDMRKLERAGVDNSKVLQAMSRHFSELAQVAQATGTQIPASLAKTFEQLADMGLLIDANGNALESWRDLFGGLPGAARAAADGIEDALSRIDVPDIRIPVSYEDPGSVSFASMGGMVGRDGVQYLARGGRVLPFAARGTDTVPAMLTPGEFVVDAASVARAGGPRGVRSKLAGSGSGATYHVTVNANDAAGGRSAAAAFDREMRRRGIRVAG